MHVRICRSVRLRAGDARNAPGCVVLRHGIRRPDLGILLDIFDLKLC
jgi:hypothetical protein